MTVNGKIRVTAKVTGSPTFLDPNVLYPLYGIREQRERAQRGEVTHKTPIQMNRHERRRVASMQRQET